MSHSRASSLAPQRYLRERLLRLLQRREHWALSHIAATQDSAFTMVEISPRTLSFLVDLQHTFFRRILRPRVAIHTVWRREEYRSSQLARMLGLLDGQFERTPVFGPWTAAYHRILSIDEFEDRTYLTGPIPGRFPDQNAVTLGNYTYDVDRRPS